MIPAKIVQFLAHANVAHAGTRDARLVPHGHSVCGWILAPDLRTLTVIVPEGAQAYLVESLEDNGQLAVTIEKYPENETYQFKGQYLRHRAAVQSDVELVQGIRERFIQAVLPRAGELAEGALRSFIQRPALAVDMEVREIYVQTPGPGAGARVPVGEA
jgi:hypothetical protein